MWPHERPEAHFTSHRLLLDEPNNTHIPQFRSVEDTCLKIICLFRKVANTFPTYQTTAGGRLSFLPTISQILL